MENILQIYLNSKRNFIFLLYSSFSIDFQSEIKRILKNSSLDHLQVEIYEKIHFNNADCLKYLENSIGSNRVCVFLNTENMSASYARQLLKIFKNTNTLCFFTTNNIYMTLKIIRNECVEILLDPKNFKQLQASKKILTKLLDLIIDRFEKNPTKGLKLIENLEKLKIEEFLYTAEKFHTNEKDLMNFLEYFLD